MTLRPESLPAASLQRGQAHEARGELPAALVCYNETIALLRLRDLREVEVRRQLGVAWMNRGNVLQKQNHSTAAISAYNVAISILRDLPPLPAHRNHLGAAWLNRGHAYLNGDEMAPEHEPVYSFEQAIGILADLPLDENLSYRINLAGAWANLAHTQLTAAPARARQAAEMALRLLGPTAVDHMSSALMSLRARRTLVLALGELLGALENVGTSVEPLANEAIDVVEEGLTIARTWVSRDLAPLLPCTLRLFRLGAQLYRMHQPHFLAEYLLENLDRTGGDNFAEQAEFRTAAEQALTAALAELDRPRLFIAHAPESLRRLEIARDLRAAQQRLAVKSS